MRGVEANFLDGLWRERIEKTFTFELVAVVNPLEVQKIDRELAARRIKLMKELGSAIAELDIEVGRICAQRTALRTAVDAAFDTLITTKHSDSA